MNLSGAFGIDIFSADGGTVAFSDFDFSYEIAASVDGAEETSTLSFENFAFAGFGFGGDVFTGDPGNPERVELGLSSAALESLLASAEADLGVAFRDRIEIALGVDLSGAGLGVAAEAAFEQVIAGATTVGAGEIRDMLVALADDVGRLFRSQAFDFARPFTELVQKLNDALDGSNLSGRVNDAGDGITVAMVDPDGPGVSLQIKAADAVPARTLDGLINGVSARLDSIVEGAGFALAADGRLNFLLPGLGFDLVGGLALRGATAATIEAGFGATLAVALVGFADAHADGAAGALTERAR